MFTKITPTTDSQLSNDEIANLIVSDALEKIGQLTGLKQKDAFALLSSQVIQHVEEVNDEQINKVQTPLLGQNECQFISNLFN
jgi:hypothetical protein